MNAQPTRRGILGAIAVAPLAGLAVAPAFASSDLEALIAEYQASGVRLTAGDEASEPQTHKLLEDNFLATVGRLDRYEPQTPREFARHLSARFDDYSIPNDEDWLHIVDTAKRLAAEGR